MNDHVVTIWNIPYLDIPITNVVVMTWIAMIAIILFAFIATRKLKQVPTGMQNLVETGVEAMNNFAEKNIGKDGRKYSAYLGTIMLFLVIANTIGALFMSTLTDGIISPPTRTLAVPAALAIMTILLIIGAGIKKRGIKGFIKKLFKPISIMFPFNLLEFIIKPLSLSMRLFGNVFGAYIAMELIFESLPWGLPAIASIYFDLFDGGLQAFVFVLLTSLYLAEEVEDEEETEEQVHRTEVKA